MKIGLGIVTYNRPAYFKKTLKGVLTHLLPLVDSIHIYNDGSDNKYSKAYHTAYLSAKDSKITIHHELVNHGVAHAKNTLLKQLFKDGCKIVFLLEDDVVPTSGQAITGYLEAMEKSGFDHFNFAHHGKMNIKPLDVNSVYTLWTDCIGAYSVYTKEMIDEVGYFDEKFTNAWEHIEHTKRICEAGYTTPFWYFIDATGSENWLKEIEGSIDNSSIRPRKDWADNIQKGMDYWATKDGQGLPERPY
jgi:GT2 family glycosyltransferase